MAQKSCGAQALWVHMRLWFHIVVFQQKRKRKRATREVAPTSHFCRFPKRKRVMWEGPPTSHFFCFGAKCMYPLQKIQDKWNEHIRCVQKKEKMRCGRSLPHHAFSFWKQKKCDVGATSRVAHFIFRRLWFWETCKPWICKGAGSENRGVNEGQHVDGWSQVAWPRMRTAKWRFIRFYDVFWRGHVQINWSYGITCVLTRGIFHFQ